jgi:putative transposase
MARLPRLALPGLPHHLIQRGHNRQIVFVDDTDRQTYIDALRETAALLKVAVHAYVLMADHLHLLVTPPTADALGRLMQGLGRRYVSAFNRRHQRVGTLWDGRYRATVLDPQTQLLACMRYIEQNPVRVGWVAQAADWSWSSAAHHVGRRRDPLVTDPAPFWAQGNTPFERDITWQRQLDEPLPAAQVQQMTECAIKGWALGPPAFLAQVGTMTGRQMEPKPRGRPRGAPKSDPRHVS